MTTHETPPWRAPVGTGPSRATKCASRAPPAAAARRQRHRLCCAQPAPIALLHPLRVRTARKASHVPTPRRPLWRAAAGFSAPRATTCAPRALPAASVHQARRPPTLAPPAPGPSLVPQRAPFVSLARRAAPPATHRLPTVRVTSRSRGSFCCVWLVVSFYSAVAPPLPSFTPPPGCYFHVAGATGSTSAAGDPSCTPCPAGSQCPSTSRRWLGGYFCAVLTSPFACGFFTPQTQGKPLNPALLASTALEVPPSAQSAPPDTSAAMPPYLLSRVTWARTPLPNPRRAPRALLGFGVPSWTKCCRTLASAFCFPACAPSRAS